jgi:pimeloyl-ACP methyl ester carboxylesterase
MAEVIARGLRTHVQRLGDGGTPVVFLHGLVMDNLSSWFFTVATPTAAFADVVLYDLRAHGRSEPTSTGFTLDDFVADLHDLRAQLGLTAPMHLVGNSFGGLLALCYAHAHPDEVPGLALVDALLPEPGWSDAMVATLGLTGDDRDKQIATSFRHWLGRHSGRKRNRLARQARRLVEESSLLDDLAASPGLSEAELSAIAAPTLLLYGEDSDVRSGGERLAALLPDAELELVAGCTHSVIWEQTALVRDRLVTWLEARC